MTEAVAGIIRKALPEVDERIWLAAAAVAGFAALFMKEAAVIAAPAAIGLFILCVRQSPEMCLYLLAAFVPFARMLSEPYEIPSLLVTGILASGTLAAHVLHSGKRRDMFAWGPLASAVLGLAALSFFSYLRGSFIYGFWYLPEKLGEIAGWLMPISFFFLSLWVVQDKKQAKTLLAIILGAVVMVALMSVYEYWNDQERTIAISDEPNRLGAFFVSYGFIFLGFFLTSTASRLGLAMLVPFLLCMRGVMVTFSRGGYVAVAAGALAIAWFRNKAIFFVLVLLAIAAITNPALLPEGVRHRVESTWRKDPAVTAQAAHTWDLTKLLEASAADRFEIWDTSVRIIRDNLWWGVGFGAFQGFLLDYSNGRMEFDNAHNMFLHVGAEMGLPGAILLALLLWIAADQSIRLYKRTKDKTVKALTLGFAAGVVALTVANLFSYCFGYQEITAYFWLLAGLITKLAVLDE